MPGERLSMRKIREALRRRFAQGLSQQRSGGRAPGGGVGAVGKWPAGATAKSLAEAGHLSTAAVIADLR